MDYTDKDIEKAATMWQDAQDVYMPLQTIFDMMDSDNNFYNDVMDNYESQLEMGRE